MTSPALDTALDPHIEANLVTSLLRTLIPESNPIALQERFEGRDYVVWRFGNDWAIRLPRRQLAADRQLTEISWLPAISADWGFKAPIPVRVVGPSGAFPWPWSIVPWIDAPSAVTAPLSDRGALELGHALRDLHQAAPQNAPRHPLRSQPLSTRGARTADRVATLARRTESVPWLIDARAAFTLLERAAMEPRPALTWTHLDLRSPHLLTSGGQLAGIIDWGDAAAGDPATDLGQALAALPPTHWDALIHGYGGLKPSAFTRARGEALDMATHLALSQDPHETRAGWLALTSLGVARPLA